MKIIDLLQKKKVLCSFEVFPPKTAEQQDSVLNAALELCSLKPDFMSVTCGAGGSTNTNTAQVAHTIQNQGNITSLAHVTCVASSKEHIQKTITGLQQKRVQNLLVLRGDLPKTDTNSTCNDFSYASDLISYIKKTNADFCIGGACYPEGHPESKNRDIDLDNLKRKVDSGVDFLTTQMFFDNDILYSFLYRAQSKGIGIPVFAGIMPVTNAAQIKRMVSLSNAYMPRKLLALVDAFSENPAAMRQAGINYAVNQIIDLIINGVRGIHLYTLNKPDVARTIVTQVQEIIDSINGKKIG